MKSKVKQLIRNVGWDLRRFDPVNSPSAQLLASINRAKINTVFDIGANIGQFSLELRAAGYAGKIVSFDPLSSAHKRLVRAARGDPRWLVYPRTAIGDRDGIIEINISENSVSSSVLPMLETHSSAAADSAYIRSESTPIIRLDSIAKSHLGAATNLFIKIDTQGYEWQVLDGAYETLKLARGVLCELSLVPLYEGQRLWRDIVDRLDAEGFMLWAILKGFTDRRTGQSLQMDGIFLRREVAEALE